MTSLSSTCTWVLWCPVIRPCLEVEVIDDTPLTVLILVMNKQLLLDIDDIGHFICCVDVDLAIHNRLLLLWPISSALILFVESI